LDPGRFVSYADDNLAKLASAQQSAANDADFLMMNQYYGTWHGPASALNPALDRVNELFPNKMVIISEFGYPGFFAKSPAQADPERIKTLQQQMPLLAARDWIAGAILWCYQDYKSRRNLWPGQDEGYVEHGVVDESRQRKPSYELWREMSAPAQIDAQWVRGADTQISGFSATVVPRTEQNIPYYPLHDYALAWSLVDAKGKVVANGNHQFEHLTAPAQITGSLPAGVQGQPLHLNVNLFSASGGLAAERSLGWPTPTQ
jgi:beta-glucuronidase